LCLMNKETGKRSGKRTLSLYSLSALPAFATFARSLSFTSFPHYPAGLPSLLLPPLLTTAQNNASVRSDGAGGGDGCGVCDSMAGAKHP